MMLRAHNSGLQSFCAQWNQHGEPSGTEGESCVIVQALAVGQADYLIQGLFDYHRDLVGEAEGSWGSFIR